MNSVCSNEVLLICLSLMPLQTTCTNRSYFYHSSSSMRLKANIFMYSHGAKLPIEGPEVPIVGHAIRGVMQVVLFGLLYQMGQSSFDALLNA